MSIMLLLRLEIQIINYKMDNKIKMCALTYQKTNLHAKNISKILIYTALVGVGG